MAQLVIAAAGAAIGGALVPGVIGLGITGASAGWTIGSLIGSAFAPGQKSQGPRLNDLSVGSSAYGTPIPYVQGAPRIAGQIVWASTKREVATTTRQGGKGGGKQKVTTYTYEVDLLIVLTDNVIGDVARVWSSGKLIWNKSASADVATKLASDTTSAWTRFAVYDGSATQLPDPTYEAAVGTANAPAYRGRGSVFIQGLQLGSSGQIPNLTFELSETALGIRDENGVLRHGLLNHFDSLSGANAVSAIGPDMLPSLGPVGIQSSAFQFGGSAMKSVIGSFYTASLTGMTLRRTKSWRVDMWVYLTTYGNGYLYIGNATGTRYVFIWFDGTGGNAYHFDIKADGLTTSGAVGALVNGLTTGTWQHMALQWDAIREELGIYNNGKRCVTMTAGALGFDISGVPTAMTNLWVGNAVAGGYVDEVRFRFIDDADVYPNLGDGVACYTPPSAPYL